jgi:hypothetical protein|tara:strand:+ start:861 stop:3344 length:2484 start_codon:yes stop_codon:yes gene_type:complete
MAIEKSFPQIQGEQSDAEEIEIAIVNPDSVSVETEDGGVMIDFTGGAELLEDDVSHSANLADTMDEADLESLSSELISQYTSDRGSRKQWETTYTKGLKLLGLEIEERSQPWAGACGVFHPVLTESVIRFQAHSIMETFPAAGPVRTQILGKIDAKVEAQAQRVQEEMNYQITEVMTNYRSEHEQMLFHLPLAGSAFKKVYYDPDMDRADSVFVPAEDLVVSYGASDLRTCSRFTHVMKKSQNEVRKLQVMGFYRDVELSEPDADYSQIQKAYDEIQGEDPTVDYDDRHTLLEMHVNIELLGDEDTINGEPSGIALPYVITLDKSSGIVLAVRRNWVEGDPKKMRVEHFVHYKFMPGLGFYGLGLVHMIGGMAKSATSILRQLVDAGTLANLPAGLKSRGLRIKGDDSPISPGEFRDVDVPGGAIRDNITFLPYKEPSQTLFALMQTIVEEARKYAAIPDMQVADMKTDAPVGTTLAIMERSMKVVSASQARLHAGLRTEFRILARIIKEYMPDQYDFDAGESSNRQEDFDGRVDIIPVSDPNASTMSQRITQYQAALQLASQAPQMYDLPVLHRQMLETLGIKDVDKIIPSSDESKPEDPSTENMHIINMKPVKAFEYQDHEAHITVHMTAMQDPKILQIVGQTPMAKAIQSSAEAHIREHLAFAYRRQLEAQLGAELPPYGEELPKDIEKKLSSLVSEAAVKLLQKDVSEAQAQENMQKAQDPEMQIKMQELQLKQADIQRKDQEGKNKILAEMEQAMMKQTLETEKITAMKEIEGSRIGARIAEKSIEHALKDNELTKKEAIEGTKIGVDIAKGIQKSFSDNQQ